MATYLLPCECGQTTPVEPHQAGDRVRCECGLELEVPPLTRLRALPTADAEGDAGSMAWGAREGVLTTTLLVSLLFAGAGGYFWANQPEPPKPFVAEKWTKFRDADITQWTPEQAWVSWWLHYRPAVTVPLQEMEFDRKDLDRNIEIYRLRSWACFAIAGVAAVLGFAASALFGRPQRGRSV